MADVNRVRLRGVCRRALADAGAGRQSAHRSVRQLRVGAKGARRRAVDHRTLLAPRACRPCEAAGRAPTVCANAQWAPAADLGHRDSQTAGQYASTRARSRHIRPSSGALGVRPASSAWLHACIGARSARLHRFGETRALSVPAERRGRTARYGRASGTASGAIGRRLPGQPVAVAQSSWPRRVQQFERASDSRAAWGRPGDGHCLPVCTRHRARRRPPSGAAAA